MSIYGPPQDEGGLGKLGDIVEDVDGDMLREALLRIFAICDDKGNGRIRKKKILNFLYTSDTCKHLVLSSPSLRKILRRNGLPRELQELRTKRRGELTYSEFEEFMRGDYRQRNREIRAEKERRKAKKEEGAKKTHLTHLFNLI